MVKRSKSWIVIASLALLVNAGGWIWFNLKADSGQTGTAPLPGAPVEQMKAGEKTADHPAKKEGTLQPDQAAAEGKTAARNEPPPAARPVQPAVQPAAAKETGKEASPAAPKLERTPLAEYTGNGKVTLLFTFSGRVDNRLFARSLVLKQGGKSLDWEALPQLSVNQFRLSLDRGDPNTPMTYSLPLPKDPDPGARVWDKSYSGRISWDSTLSLREISTDSGGFSTPRIFLKFSEIVDPVEATKHITLSPSVKFTVSADRSYWWDEEQLILTGDFDPTKSYRVTLDSGLVSQSGKRIGRKIWRTARFAPMAAALRVANPGRYLAPEGRLTVPVETINCSSITCNVARIPPHNLVQFVMRESDSYPYWYGGNDEERTASMLTEKARSKVLSFPYTLNKIKTVNLRLAEMLQKGERGVFLLNLQAPGEVSEARLIAVTDLGVSARESETGLTVWVNSLQKATPVEGCEVAIYSQNNICLGKKKSSKRGLCEFTLGKSEEERPVSVIVSRADGKDQTFLPLTRTLQTEMKGEGNKNFPDPRLSEAFVMTDRDIYRPGETLFVQGLLRDWMGRAPKPFPVLLKIIMPNGRLFDTKSLMPDRLGALVHQVTLPSYVPMGNYTLVLTTPGKRGREMGRKAVKVEAFVPPQTRLSFKGIPEVILPKTRSFEAKIYAEHLFGKAAEGLSTELAYTYKAVPFEPEGWKGYLFGDQAKEHIYRSVKCGIDKTDKKGLATYEIELDRDLCPAGALQVVFQGAVIEASGRSVKKWEPRPYHVYPFYIGMKSPERYAYRPSEKITTRIAQVAPDGKRWTRPADLAVRLERVSWNYSLVKKEEGYEWKSTEIKTPVESYAIHTLPGQDTPFTFSTATPGRYRLTAMDKGSRSSTSWEFMVEDNSFSSYQRDGSDPEYLDFVFDKKSYKPGDIAHIRLTSPFKGTAWISLQHKQVLENWVIPMTNNTASFSLKVTEAFLPNVEIAATVIRPAQAESSWSAHRARGIRTLKVTAPKRQLDLKIETAPIVLPRRDLEVRVTARQWDGSVPREAAVTVMAVDEAICMLTGYRTPDPEKFFSLPRTAGIRFFDVYRQLMKITADPVGTVSHIGGDGDGDLLFRMNPIAARRFKPLARWSANVKFDNRGEATVRLPLPEFSGEVRVMAVAWSETAEGSAEQAVKVRRPVIVQPDLSRILAPGDRSLMTVSLHNEARKRLTVNLEVTVDGAVACRQPTQQVDLAADESRVVTVPIEALQEVGKGRIRVRASGFGEPFEEELEISVRPACAWETSFAYGKLEPGKQVRLDARTDILPSSSLNAIRGYANAKIDLEGAVDYLLSYPYGCLEQTTSIAFSLMMLDRRQREALMPKISVDNEVDTRIKSALDRLRTLEREDGFAMWPASSRVAIDESLYAAFFMANAMRMNKGVSRGEMDRILGKLSENVSFLSSSSEPKGIRGVRLAYLCHIRSLANRPDENMMAFLSERKELLSTEALFHLARAWKLSGNGREARKILDAVNTGDTIDIEMAALGAVVYLEIDPDSEMIPALLESIRKLMEKSGHWGTTRRNARCIWAFSEYDKRFPMTEEKTVSAKLSWEGGVLSISPTNRFSWTQPVEMIGKPVTLANTGNATIYYTRKIHGIPRVEKLLPLNKGLTVSRTLFSPDGVELRNDQLVRGEVVIVEIRLKAPDGGESIVVSDLLPACLEIEQGDLGKKGTYEWIKRDESEWVLNQEIRDDRLLLFSKAFSRKEVTFHYAARVVSQGTFTLPAITAQEMYAPEKISRSEGSTVKVK